MITFDELWRFLETTHVTSKVLHIICPEGNKISPEDYIIQTYWESRFDFAKLKNYWEDRYTFLTHGNINPTVRKLIEEIENDNDVHAHAHVYAGKFGSRSFPIHSDLPDNLIIQCVGKSRVTLYDNYSTDPQTYNGDVLDLSLSEQIILSPGDSIYISSLRYHLFEPLSDRIGISIPMIKI
jgi:ribosomal protein L16 Arg81 hydroxylase